MYRSYNAQYPGKHLDEPLHETGVSGLVHLTPG